MITARYSFDRKPVFLGGDVGNIGDENFCKVFGLLIIELIGTPRAPRGSSISRSRTGLVKW